MHLAADLTKITTSLTVATFLLYNRNTPSILYVLGAAANSATGKLLKKIIQQPRPTNAKSDPGMPSSHATSLSFLTVAFLAYVTTWPVFVGVFPHSVVIGGAAGLVVIAAIATLCRVSAGYHTKEQVLAGWVLGAVDAIIWKLWFVPWAGPTVNRVLSNERIAGLVIAGMILVSSTR